MVSKKSVDVMILGGGLSGLAAANRLSEAGREVVVLEASHRLGGLATSIRKDGFVCDIGPHALHSSLVDRMDLQQECFDAVLKEQIHTNQKFKSYPFGLLKNLRYVQSVGMASLIRSIFKPDSNNLEERLLSSYGKPFVRDVIDPLFTKWLGTPLREMSTDIGRKLDPPGLRILVHHLVSRIVGRQKNWLQKDRSKFQFCRNGTIRVPERLVEKGKFELLQSHPVDKIEIDNERIVAVQAKGERYTPKSVISTLPLSLFNQLCGEHPKTIAYADLKYRGVIFLFLRYRRSRIMEKLWAWFPEAGFDFYRLSETKAVAQDMGPESETILTAEIPSFPEEPTYQRDSVELLGAVVSQIDAAYPGTRQDYIDGEVLRFPHVYPLFTAATESLWRSIDVKGPFENLYFAGRQGRFRYLMTDTTYASGIEAANAILQQ